MIAALVRPAGIGVVILTCMALRSYASDFRPVAQDSQHGAFGLSHNGQVVVGSRYQAFRWTPSGGLEWLPFPVPQGSNWMGCRAKATNGDGSKVYMTCQSGVHHVINYPIVDYKPYVYQYQTGTLTEWPRLHDQSYPLDATPDGSVVVGYDWEVSGLWLTDWAKGVKWTNGSIFDLGRADAEDCGWLEDDDSYAMAVSDDGSIIAGVSGELGDYWRPVVWSGGSIRQLASRPCGPDDHYLVADVSGDGNYVVGHYRDGDSDPPYPVWWNTTTGDLTQLSLLATDTVGQAYCTNRDGSLIGGHSGDRAVVWDRATGTPQLAQSILQQAGLAPKISGWQLGDVFRMSSDGKQMAGYGIHPNGQRWIWWADLRNPPQNDRCVSAQNITPNHVPWHIFTGEYQVTGTTAEAAKDGDSVCAGEDPFVNVWYKYTAPVDGYLLLTLCGSFTTLHDAFISVHTGCPGGSANQVYCRKDCPSRSDCNLPCMIPPIGRLTAGQTYYIQVGGKQDEGHAFTLTHRFLPVNDDCDDAVMIESLSLSTPGLTGLFSPDTVPSCMGVTSTSKGVWYKVVGTGTTITASLCDSADYDTQLSVYCGGCGGLSCVAANDDGCGPRSVRSSVTWCSQRGQIYHVLVHGADTEFGSFRLDLSQDSQRCTPLVNCHPAHEECSGAMPVSSGTTESDNTSANTSAISASCAPSGHDVWFSYTTRCDGQLWVDTCQTTEGSLTDSVVSLYDACGGTELTCNDDYSDETVDCGLRSAAIADIEQGRSVRIRVAGYGTPGYEGSFPLRLTEVPADLTVYTGPLSDAVTNEPYAADIGFYGSCGVRRISADGLPPGLSINMLTGEISGVPLVADIYPIHVEVCDQIIPDGHCTDGEVTIRVLPSNDDCDNALPVVEGHQYLSNIGATTDGPDEPDACNLSGYTHVESDVWFGYTSSCDGIAVVDVCEVGYDSKLAVYPGHTCPSAPGAWLCNDDACNLGSSLAFPVEHGMEYLLRVGGYAGAQGQGHMLITCFNDCNANEQSDTEEILAGAPDCNANAKPDVCDVRGDFNDDGAFNLPDVSAWIDCMTGPCGPPACDPPLYRDPCCGWIDLLPDGDIDLRNWSVFQQAMGGGLDLRACSPEPDGQSCKDVHCGGPRDCAPTMIRINSNEEPATHRILHCDCQRFDACYVEVTGPGSVGCTGGCPEGTCTLNSIDHGEGITDYFCECGP